ncbi:MAG: hypothetical protein M3P91_08125 [Actinomycetota bacterium]|nr:hypothetical protein [Actinomycetota bacterium]
MSQLAKPGDDSFDEQAALEEIDLYTEVLIAAGSASGPLSTDELDRVLGIRRDDEG